MTKKVAIDIVARDKTKRAIDSSNKGLARLKKSVFSLKTAFVSLGAGIVLRGFVQAGIQIQNLEVQLKSLTGSAVAGRKVLNEVTQFAATTPFELADIQRGVTSLITVKERAEQAGVSFKELLTIAGNTAVILGGDFELASLQLQRSFSAGIASADTFRDRGVTAMAGFQAGVRTSVSESIKGLNEAFGSGGKFGTIMNDLANTVQGKVSNLQDIFFLFQASVAEGFFDELETQLGDLQDFLIQNEREIKEFGRQTGEVLATALDNLGRSLAFVNKHFAETEILLGILLILTGKIKGKVGGIALIIDGIRRDFIALNKELGIGEDSFNNASDAADDFSGNIDLTAKEISEAGEILRDYINRVDSSILKQKNLNSAFLLAKKTFEEGGIELHRYNKLLQKFANDGVRGAVTELRTFSNIIKNNLSIALDKSNTAVRGFTDALARAIVTGQSMGDVFKNVGISIVTFFISSILEAILMATFLGRIIDFINDKFKNQEDGSKDTAKALDDFSKSSAIASASQVALATSIDRTNAALARQNQLSQGGSSKGSVIGSVLGFAVGGSTGAAIGGFIGGMFAEGGRPPINRPSIVGEKGAELFVPDSAGTIIPNNQLGGSTNVTFNINTVDARGFNELLQGSRGMIVNMINSAVNERGRGNLI
tara:strand:- start:446 stop:2413 length:1968 start_codon:yes stop_codon:yes gene_type:complete